jgi:hypothetical protein
MEEWRKLDQALMLLTYIPEVPDSNLGQNTNYILAVFHDLPQFFQASSGIKSQ